jgi:hypothetical protein
MTPGGLRAQYLIPNLSPKCECLSTNSSLLLGPRHHAIPRNQRKQSFCRTEANCQPQAPLPNPFEENLPSSGRIFSPSWAHKSDYLLYQILVLTPRNAYTNMLDNMVSPITCVSMNHQNQLEQMANEASLHKSPATAEFSTPGQSQPESSVTTVAGPI